MLYEYRSNALNRSRSDRDGNSSKNGLRKENRSGRQDAEKCGKCQQDFE